MRSSWSSPAKRRLLVLVGILALLAGLGLALGRSLAQTGYDPNNLQRVEEDWSLLVTTPDANVASPQISTEMIRSPDALRFCTFHLNSCDIPTYNQGGLQVQAWEGTACMAVQTSENRNTMTTANELVQWTQYLQKDSSDLKFGISAASSDTWGDFSGVEITVPNSGAYLGSYSINYSVAKSGITYGANRVLSLVLLRVRGYDNSGNLLFEDLTPRTVYSQTLGGDN